VLLFYLGLEERFMLSQMIGIDALKDALDSLMVEQGVLSKVSTWPWEPEAARVVVTALLVPVGLWIVTRVLQRLG